jgi:hypothetical protein
MVKLKGGSPDLRDNNVKAYSEASSRRSHVLEVPATPWLLRGRC